MEVLSGQYEHVIDPKGRLILPKAFRAYFGTEGVISPDRLGCLSLWTAGEWSRRVASENDRAEQGTAADRKQLRFVLAYSQSVSFDDQGRFALPVKAREFAGLDGDVLINGVLGHLEIWNPTTWRESFAGVEELFREEG